MSRWKYRTFEVEDGENKQVVRELTSSEMRAFREKRDASKIEINGFDRVVSQTVSTASLDPPVTFEEAEEMPPLLRAACFSKIMQLSQGDQKKAMEPETEEPDPEPVLETPGESLPQDVQAPTPPPDQSS